MAGRAKLLAVFYHESLPLPDKTQQLGYSLWNAENLRLISRGSVSCLSKGSSISWAGFSNNLSLTVMDSDGMISMLFPTGGWKNVENTFWEWIPALDTVGFRKSRDDNHWPITVYNGKLICVPLKGGMLYPDANRRPVTSTISLRIPLARSVVPEQSALEDLSLRSNMALTQKIFVDENNLNRDIGLDMDDLEKEHNLLRKQVDKVTIKLFAAMVDNGKFDNALELVNRLHSEKSYEIAMVYADRQNERLAKRIEKKMKINFDEKYLHEVYSDICQEGVSQALQTNQGRSISNQISNGIQKRSLNSKNPAKAGNKRLRDT